MKGFTTAMIILAVSAFPSFCQEIPRKSETEQEILKREIAWPDYPDRTYEMPTVFRRTLIRLHLPGGSVQVDCSDSRKFYVFPAGKSSLQAMLSSMERIDPTYHWQFAEGTINLLPRQGMPELLDLRIENFIVAKVTTQDALYALLAHSDVKRKMAELGLDKGYGPPSTLQYYNPNPNPANIHRFDLELKNVTFRQILNEIVKVEGKRTWNYVEMHCSDQLRFYVDLNG